MGASGLGALVLLLKKYPELNMSHRDTLKQGETMTSEQARANALKHGMSYEASYHNWYKYKDIIDLTIEEYIQMELSKPKGTVLKLIGRKMVPMSRADATRLQKMRCDNTSGYYGVSPVKKRGNWRWDVMVRGEKIGKAGYASPNDAAIAREAYIIEHGITARRNF